MRLVITLVLLGAGATAAAEPRACKPNGGVLVEIDQRTAPKHKLVTATTRLYDNGAWTSEWIDVDRTVARRASGCVQPDRMATLRDRLRAARWSVTHGRSRCGARSPRFTQYKWKGRIVFTERSCGGDALDDESAAALRDLATRVVVPDDLDGADEVPRGPWQRPRIQDCLDNPLARGC